MFMAFYSFGKVTMLHLQVDMGYISARRDGAPFVLLLMGTILTISDASQLFKLTSLAKCPGTMQACFIRTTSWVYMNWNLHRVLKIMHSHFPLSK